MTYSIAWQAGPSAQIELFSADPNAETDSFRFKYSPSMRKTLRPPMTGLYLGERALLPVRAILDELIGLIDTRSNLPVPPPPGSPPANEVFDRAHEAGNMLMELILPDDARADLTGSDNMFLEIGLDEKLLEYPWELMFENTTGFLCCRHSIGRFVNVTATTPLKSTANARFGDGPLSILLISVPNPMPRVGSTKPAFAPLPGARMETEAIVNTASIPGVELTALIGPDATWMAVVNALKGPKRFHIVHFNGHAYFDEANPNYSSLVLHDKDIEAGPIYRFFRNKPPVLFFMNGCETAMAHGARPWKNRYDIFGLARAFLDTGAYLLGTRWKVGDGTAAMFAEHFYRGVLDGQPLGTVVRDARCACMQAALASQSGDFSWASYSYYGDPRLYFRKMPDPPAPPPPAAATVPVSPGNP